MKRAEVQALAQRQLAKLGLTNHILVAVGEAEWQAAEGRGHIAPYRGRADGPPWGYSQWIIGLSKYQKAERETVKATTMHEILHCLYPKRAHWWIELTAEVLIRGSEWKYGRYSLCYGRYSLRYGKHRDDIPGYGQLQAMVAKQALRWLERQEKEQT